MFLMCKKVFDDINFQIFKQILDSDFTPTYNPFIEWWEHNQDRPYDNEIMKLWRCIEIVGDWDKMVYFGTKWLVALVSCIHYKQKPLVFTLTGPIGIGKTEFYRQLLPQSWRSPVDYYAETSTLGQGTDDDILMTQKILVIDDEFGGMGKKEERKFKAITDKQIFSLRRPYGHGIEDLRRLCLLGANCNEDNVLSDPSGNRRILPFKVLGIDWEAIAMIDRDALWAEVWRMYDSGFNCSVVKQDIERLADGNDEFIDYSMEFELIQKYYEVPKHPNDFGVSEASASAIKEYIDRMSGQRCSLNKIGQELKRIGFSQVPRKANGKTVRAYQVIEKRIGGLHLPGSEPEISKWTPPDIGTPF
jgi:predicted P-loop ATPase